MGCFAAWFGCMSYAEWAESKYAQIENEMLVIVFGVETFETFELYVYGKRFKVETDHKPLESILRKSLLSAPKRLHDAAFTKP